MSDHDETLARLDELEAASRQREAELAALADEVPQAVSRVAVLRQLAASWRDLLPGRRRGS